MQGKLSPDGKTIIFKIPMRFHRRGGRRMVILPEHAEARKRMESPSDDPMVNAVVKARRWQNMLESGKVSSIRRLAEKENVDPSFVGKMLRLNSLAPDIVEAILDGKTPETLNLEVLRRGIPLAWSEQREVFGVG